MDIFKRVNDAGKTIVVVTHEHDIAAMTKRNIVLKDGFVVDEKKQEECQKSEVENVS